ncbi:MAG: hypothetical protein ACR2OW_15395 [Methyloligellaceae bacterium]
MMISLFAVVTVVLMMALVAGFILGTRNQRQSFFPEVRGQSSRFGQLSKS